jgi:FAD-linked oxidoreductase
MMKRRSMLGALVAAAGAGSLPLASFAADSAAPKKRRLPWRNWSGSQQCLPEARLAPASVAELQELITSTTGTLRPVGAGHSFTPLVPTDGTIISMGRLSGIVSHDATKLQATICGGTRLGDIGQPLEDLGQALTVMPDIDEQALAGSIATATHGTGANMGAIHDHVTALKLVTAKGELLECSPAKHPEIFQAAKVSIGALGVITEVTLQNQAPYNLRRDTRWRETGEILARAEKDADQYRNYEFYVVPFSGMGFVEALDLTDEPLGSTDKLDMNDGAEDLKLARDWLEDWPKLRELIVGGYMSMLDDEISIKSSWNNFVHERNVRFNEMEFHLPRENGIEALREIITTLEKNHPEVFFPIEVRFVKGDDAWLSPFYQRDSISIAVHRYFEEDYNAYFASIEPIFRKYKGRPHWGKLNTLDSQDFGELYPHWDDFKAVRRELDSEGRFLNSYLRELFT